MVLETCRPRLWADPVRCPVGPCAMAVRLITPGSTFPIEMAGVTRVYAFLTLASTVLTRFCRATRWCHLRTTSKQALERAARGSYGKTGCGAPTENRAGSPAGRGAPDAARTLDSRRAPIAQLAEAADLKSAQCRFESDWGHKNRWWRAYSMIGTATVKTFAPASPLARGAERRRGRRAS